MRWVLSLAVLTLLSPLFLLSRSPQPIAVVTPYKGIWISADELACLPPWGAAWNQLKEVADEPAGTPDLSDQDEDTDIRVLAKALVYARTGQTRYRDDVLQALHVVTYNNTENGGRTLALGRNLVSYVIAADLINLPAADSDLDGDFRDKLRELLSKTLDGNTLRSTHEERANNWGTNAGASRAAVAVYLGDQAELERTALIFKGWVGDRATYAGFRYGDDLSWQADPEHPVPVNPKGAVKEGHSIDGALPEEMRRGGPFQWPPKETNYPWGALQGSFVQALILARAGYPDVWEWEDRALLRSVQFLYNTVNWPAEGDDEWLVWLINAVYGTNFPAVAPAHPGKNMGWTDWTHSGLCYSAFFSVYLPLVSDQ